MRATIAGHTGRNDEMIDILKHKPPYNSQYAFYYLDYMLGLAKLRRLDSDADVYFKIFTIKYKGKQYMKSAYRYLAWSCLLNNDIATAKTYYSLVTKHGIGIIEEDKYADKEAKAQILWPSGLLKARLLFDGKYFAQSMKVLQTIDAKVISNTRFKLEFSYRKARVLHETKAYNEAIVLYKEIIQKGQNATYYYAAFSALQLGYIYDILKQSKTAIAYYKMALDDFPENEEYESSIEQKAKAALKKHHQ
jgi:tetratricopeptide (TPR) repeat protein